jgi:transposase
MARGEALPAMEVVAALADVRPVSVEPVPGHEQAVWDATMAAHHAQGFRRAFGAHQRYWIYGQVAGQRVILGGLLFAAAARHVAVRDVWLGWTPLQRKRFRYRVVANSRFLIRQGVQVPHLASHALALALRRLPADWRSRFGYEPVVVETFVRPPWRGTCYRAANWLHLGQSKGTGRQDRRYREPGSVKHVFVYPLTPNFREALVRPGTSERSGAWEGTAAQVPRELIAAHIQQRFALLSPWLDEKQRRLLAAAEAHLYGTEHVEQVAAWVGLSPTTIRAGLRELQHPETIEPERVRRPGGGRKPTSQIDPTLLADLDVLVAPETRGDPQSPLRWTCKSTRKLAQELNQKGHVIGHATVAKLLHQLGYSLQANRKLREGKVDLADRDAQFRHINATVQDYQDRGQPVISIDTKKKELVGDFKNGGREWQPKGKPEAVQVHDFQTEQGKVCPYGIYDLTRNEAMVNVGTDHDTAVFAVNSIASWWTTMGQAAYPEATELLITADGGGSNNPRCRLWRTQLQRLADMTGLTIAVSHFPPGTSKWNKVEHRLFSYITMNTRGRPLTSHEVIVNLIAHTTTSTGLKVQCRLDRTEYPTGLSVSDEELKQVQIERDDFHPEWNYRIRPHRSTS